MAEKIVSMNIRDISEGDIVARDVYIGRTLLVPRGTVIKPYIIERMLKFKVMEVPIKVHDSTSEETKKQLAPAATNDIFAAPDYEQLDQLMEQQDPDDINEITYQVFMEGLKRVVTESRYGLAFNDNKQLSYVYELWQTLLGERYYLQLIQQLKQWDLPTYEHSLDTFILGALFAKHIGTGDEELFAAACMLHDIGKFKIPRKILANESKLQPEEFAIIKMHVDYGVQMLGDHDPNSPLIPIVQQHHERMDGSGYPKGLKEKDIDLFARMLMVIDVYSALTLKRPYRTPLTSEKALEVMLFESRLYDSYVLREFIQMLHIFPQYANLELTDGNVVMVTNINPQVPYLPMVLDKEKGKAFQIPNDLSVSVRRMLSWPGMNQFQNYNGYVIGELRLLLQNYLLLGEKQKVISLFQSLLNTMLPEVLFFQMLLKGVKWIQQMHHLGVLKQDVYQKACEISRDVLVLFRTASTPVKREEKVAVAPLLFVQEGERDGQWMADIASAGFALKGYRTIMLHHGFTPDELLECVKTEKVRYLCVVAPTMMDVLAAEPMLRNMKQQANVVVALCTDFLNTPPKSDQHRWSIELTGDLPQLIENITLIESVSSEKNTG